MAGHRVCPWWLGPLLTSPIRRFRFNPAQILSPYVRPGMTVLEPGPGMGFFTTELAQLVGPTGRVVAVDVQQKMLNGLKRRISKINSLVTRVETRLSERDSMHLDDLAGQIDFILAAAVVHEMPSAAAFFREAVSVLKPSGSILLIEPAGHVSDIEFEEELQAATLAGLRVSGRPVFRKSNSALLSRM
jgi:ubiquinone/menaquinone biosynthesis C-methylase UbiE